VELSLRGIHDALSEELDRSTPLAAAQAHGEAGRHAAPSPGGHPELLQSKALLRRGRGYRNLNYLLLKAQRLAATRTQLVAFQKAA